MQANEIIDMESIMHESYSDENSDQNLDAIDLLDININIFKLCDRHGRSHTIATLTKKLFVGCLSQLGSANLTDKVNEGLVKILEGYQQFNAAYHNEIHGFDVAQMTNFVLSGEDGYSAFL